MLSRRQIIAHHLILTGYGHWLMNDLRGSGSTDFHDSRFAELSPIHHGRKPDSLQPSRPQLREFYQQADELLIHPRLWFDDDDRESLAAAIGEVIATKRYTCYACAILSNHLHLVIRKHRDDALAMLNNLMEATRLRLRAIPRFGEAHPIWAERPYKVFLYTPDDVWRVVRYIRENPTKEGLPAQHWAFVKAYDNWPFHKPAGRR